VSEVVYQPQYRKIDCYNREQWFDAGHPVDRATALNMVRANPEKYLGTGRTHRMLEVTRRVVRFDIDFKENK
jgi:hypothetical protein